MMSKFSNLDEKSKDNQKRIFSLFFGVLKVRFTMLGPFHNLSLFAEAEKKTRSQKLYFRLAYFIDPLNNPNVCYCW